jgi:hypothetical protein
MNTNDTIYTNDNTVFNDNAVNATINNKGFSILDSIFKQYQWHLVKNDLNFISYTKIGDETNHFDFKILKDKIVVSVPIKNSSYQFVTNFKSYFEASEFAEQKLIDYSN